MGKIGFSTTPPMDWDGNENSIVQVMARMIQELDSGGSVNIGEWNKIWKAMYSVMGNSDPSEVCDPNKQGSAYLNAITSALGGGQPPLQQYDTVIGVGASLCDGIFKLTPQFWENNTYIPFRGTSFRSASVPGTTLQNILDNIANFTNLASGRTLFVMMGGGNDCSTYLSPGGAGDGDPGSVGKWDDLTDSVKSLTETKFRDIVTALKLAGDVAIVNMTFRDYKGVTLGSPNQDSIGMGSWNTGLNNPLCRELTPEWYDEATGKPIIDFYGATLADPSVIDDDNVHQYSDYTYTAIGAGYPNGPGSYTLRTALLEALYSNGAAVPTPFDDSLYNNRILVNIGIEAGLQGRPSFQRWATQIPVVTRQPAESHNLNRWDATKNTSASVALSDFPAAYGRGNLGTLDQIWDEGIRDRNLLSSSVGTADPITFTFDDIGTSGAIEIAGLYSTTAAADPARKAKFSVTDSDGTRSIEVDNNVNGLGTAPDTDFIAKFTYRLDVADKLVITSEKATGASYGYIGGIQIDIGK